jgi:hypothetical protein
MALGDTDDPWMAAMRCGDFARAWRINDEVLRRRVVTGDDCSHWPRHLQFVWDGRPLADQRVLVRCYHGLGDTIQFIRFAEPLSRIAREVIVWAQPALLSLIATASGVDRVLALHDGVPDVPYDVDVEVMELPYALRISREGVRCRIPYLFPGEPPPVVHVLRTELRPRVGVVWQAGEWAPHRSIPCELVATLAHASNIGLFSLQGGPARGDAARVGAYDLGWANVSETASLLRDFDLVITVDTLMAHLAGAVGVPVWTLLSADCDWRWMSSGSTSPWYPSMRLFRQGRLGDWDSVLRQVSAELSQHSRAAARSSMQVRAP